jgi:hypothetical protein
MDSKITHFKLIGVAAILSAAIATLSRARSATWRFIVIWTAFIVLNICTAMFDTGSAWFDDEPKGRSDGRIALPCIAMQQASSIML